MDISDVQEGSRVRVVRYVVGDNPGLWSEADFRDYCESVYTVEEVDRSDNTVRLQEANFWVPVQSVELVSGIEINTGDFVRVARWVASGLWGRDEFSRILNRTYEVDEVDLSDGTALLRAEFDDLWVPLAALDWVGSRESQTVAEVVNSPTPTVGEPPALRPGLVEAGPPPLRPGLIQAGPPPLRPGLVSADAPPLVPVAIEEPVYLDLGDFEEGDRVRVARKVVNTTVGWDGVVADTRCRASWSPDMDDTVGLYGTVTDISIRYLSVVVNVEGRSWHYSPMALEKVEDAQEGAQEASGEAIEADAVPEPDQGPESPHSPRTAFQEGDRVRIVRRAEPSGWGASWIPAMDRMVSRREEGVVYRVSNALGCRVHVQGQSSYWFPPEALESLDVPSVSLPIVRDDTQEFQVGDRVRITARVDGRRSSSRTRDAEFDNSWTEEMTGLIGRTGQVVRVYYPGTGVRVICDGSELGYSPRSLRLVSREGHEVVPGGTADSQSSGTVQPQIAMVFGGQCETDKIFLLAAIPVNMLDCGVSACSEYALSGSGTLPGWEAGTMVNKLSELCSLEFNAEETYLSYGPEMYRRDLPGLVSCSVLYTYELIDSDDEGEEEPDSVAKGLLWSATVVVSPGSHDPVNVEALIDNFYV